MVEGPYKSEADKLELWKKMARELTSIHHDCKESFPDDDDISEDWTSSHIKRFNSAGIIDAIYAAVGQDVEQIPGKRTESVLYAHEYGPLFFIDYLKVVTNDVSDFLHDLRCKDENTEAFFSELLTSLQISEQQLDSILLSACRDIDALIDELDLLRAPIYIDYRTRHEMNEARNQEVSVLISRIDDGYASANDLKKQYCDLEEKVTSANTSITALEPQVKKAAKALNKANSKAKNMQKEYITLLSILIAVVLAFNAAITFTADSIDAVKTMNPFSIGFVVSIVGCLLFDALYVLFRFLHQVIDVKNRQWELRDIKLFISINLILLAVVLSIGDCAYWTDESVTNSPSGCVAFVAAVVSLVFAVAGCHSFRMLLKDAYTSKQNASDKPQEADETNPDR